MKLAPDLAIIEHCLARGWTLRTGKNDMTNRVSLHIGLYSIKSCNNTVNQIFTLSLKSL
jgi:hypothetical protein